MFIGTVRLGGVESITLMVNAAVPIFPAASEAGHITVVVPSAKCEPVDGVHVGPEVTPTLSVADG